MRPSNSTSSLRHRNNAAVSLIFLFFIITLAVQTSLCGKQDRKRKTSYANKITYTRQTPWIWVSGRRVPVFPTSPKPTRIPYSPMWKKRDAKKAARAATANLTTISPAPNLIEEVIVEAEEVIVETNTTRIISVSDATELVN